MVGNVRKADDGKVYVAGDELLVVRAAESATASGGEVADRRDGTDEPSAQDLHSEHWHYG